MSNTRATRLPGVTWQGRPSEIEEMYHLFDVFKLDIAWSEDKMVLALLMAGADEPIMVRMGDRVVLDKDPYDENSIGQLGIIRGHVDYSGDPWLDDNELT